MCLIMFINFKRSRDVPAKFKCNPSLGAYKEESGRLLSRKLLYKLQNKMFFLLQNNFNSEFTRDIFCCVFS